MLTPVEIQKKQFKSGVSGYDKKEVDLFMNEIIDSFDELYHSNKELNDKVNQTTAVLEYYKKIEKTMQKALVLAQQTAEDTENKALRNARLIEEEANQKALAILQSARDELKNLKLQAFKALQEYNSYKARFKALANAQLDVLESNDFSIDLEAFEENNLSDFTGGDLFAGYYEEDNLNENSETGEE